MNDTGWNRTADLWFKYRPLYQLHVPQPDLKQGAGVVKHIVALKLERFLGRTNWAIVFVSQSILVLGMYMSDLKLHFTKLLFIQKVLLSC